MTYLTDEEVREAFKKEVEITSAIHDETGKETHRIGNLKDAERFFLTLRKNDREALEIEAAVECASHETKAQQQYREWLRSEVEKIQPYPLNDMTDDFLNGFRSVKEIVLSLLTNNDENP